MAALLSPATGLALQSGRSQADFQYVGLDRSIGRIDPATGRFWLLVHPDGARASLLQRADSADWHWQEVRISSDAPRNRAVQPLPPPERTFP
ncbi:MAG: hypothetical protein U1A27_12600 [Phycisphaerae bacterium]